MLDYSKLMFHLLVSTVSHTKGPLSALVADLGTQK